MDDTTSAGLSAGPRRPNARGQGERLREEIISAAVQMLGDLADDEALSLRAVARAVSISPTSVYLYFPDRDALVAAEEGDAGRLGLGDPGRERRCAAHPAEGLQVPAFVDDRDRDQCDYLGRALVCAGDDCLSLLQR